MKINQFRDRGLEEDYMDVHYREYNDEIRRILALTESGNARFGENRRSAGLSVSEKFIILRQWTGNASPV